MIPSTFEDHIYDDLSAEFPQDDKPPAILEQEVTLNASTMADETLIAIADRMLAVDLVIPADILAALDERGLLTPKYQ